MPSSPRTATWGAPTQETLVTGRLGAARTGRNVADMVYLSPGLSAFRATDGEPRVTTERFDPPGGRAPPFLRRVVGAAAGVLTDVTAQLDSLPLDLTPGQARPDFARVALTTAGITVPEDLPDAAVVRLHAALPSLRPLGRPTAFLLAFEAVMGSGTREVTTSGAWRHTAARSGEASVTVSEVLLDLDPPDPYVASGAVIVTLRGVPDAVGRLMQSLRIGAFETPVVKRGDPDPLAHLWRTP